MLKYGGIEEQVQNVTFAVAGAKDNVIDGTPGYTVTQDMTAVVFYALGEKQFPSWDCSVPKDMFIGLQS